MFLLYFKIGVNKSVYSFSSNLDLVIVWLCSDLVKKNMMILIYMNIKKIVIKIKKNICILFLYIYKIRRIVILKIWNFYFMYWG